MGRCIIFGAGDCWSVPVKPRAGDLVIAADGGFRNCVGRGIMPDLLLGDFDSMEQPADFPNCIRVPAEKDDTDTMLALREGLARGYREFHLCGCTGGERLDHTIANLQALIFLRKQGARGYLYDKGFTYTAIENECFSIQKQVEWGIVSLFCMGGDATGVTLTGLQYPLHDGALSAALPLGVSNHIVADVARIEVKNGLLLVAWQTN